MKRPPPARLHLLPAKSAPSVVVIRRKPTDWFHVLRWNTETDHVEHGAWYRGTLYPRRADVSFDGQLLVFLAMDPGAHTFNRISRPPFLEPIVEAPADGTYRGGGYWEDAGRLRLNGWFTYAKGRHRQVEAALGQPVESYDEELGDEGVLYRRLLRDGWQRAGDNWGTTVQLDTPDYAFECTGDDGWAHRPTPLHPVLRMVNTGYRRGALQFRFWLPDFPALVPPAADWACWDASGQLLFAARGVLYRYRLDDLARGLPAAVIDLEDLAPPQAPAPASAPGSACR